MKKPCESGDAPVITLNLRQRSQTFIKARPGASGNNQIMDIRSGCVAVGGSWTQAVIVLDGSVFDTNTLIVAYPTQ